MCVCVGVCVFVFVLLHVLVTFHIAAANGHTGRGGQRMTPFST